MATTFPRLTLPTSAYRRAALVAQAILMVPCCLGRDAFAGDCPGVGDCCFSHSTPGCNNSACCNEVCAEDPFCCEREWDSFCVDIADEVCDICGPICGDTICEPGETWPECPECPEVVTCPGVGDCCVAHLSNGCTDEECCLAVCDLDPSCCANGWDSICVGQAEDECPGLCTPTCGDTICEPGETWPECPECPPVDPCPGVGDCCETHASIGCTDEQCCDAVCILDASCCETGWDAICVNLVEDNCPGLCGPVCGDTVCEPGETWPECPECPPVVSCPGSGDCCQTHASAGCDDRTCCETVCTSDPSCCDTSWDASCVAAAERECGCGTAEPADINGDGTVGQSDLAILLGDWGQPGGDADIDGDGTVGQTDLALLLGAWD
ncbi:MAG: hypothetical protein JNL80_05010 [Phycisphaerae bacterium]|nr:hypothetical protein [Phycisphaerae bacterium]